MSPGVSVVMAVKDGERFIGEALDSVAAQTLAPSEIVVVDGGSRDRSAAIARGYDGVRVLDQRGTGFSGAWNEGIEAAEGELIAILDSDDRWLPEKLERQVALLDTDEGVDYVIGRMRFVLEPGKPLPKGFREELLEGSHWAHMPSAVLIRRRAFDRVGAFDESFGITSDIDWFARAKDAPLQLGRVDEVVVEKRVHDSNLSLFAAEDYNRQLLSSLRETIQRQRGGGG